MDIPDGMAGRRWIARTGAALALGIGLAVIGPYGTYGQLALPERLAYWVGIVGLNWAQVALSLRVLGRRLKSPDWPWTALPVAAACIASFPAALEVTVLEHWMRPGQREAAAAGLAEIYFLVLVLTLPVTVLLARLRLVAGGVADTPSSGGGSARFFERIPPALGRDLLCLRTEDHYLRVTTAMGEELILMRMADAEVDLRGFDGLRVHRSWWVARAAVRGVERDGGGRLWLVLCTGLRVPVSRSQSGAVRAAGWLGRG